MVLQTSFYLGNLFVQSFDLVLITLALSDLKFRINANNGASKCALIYTLITQDQQCNCERNVALTFRPGHEANFPFRLKATKLFY